MAGKKPVKPENLVLCLNDLDLPGLGLPIVASTTNSHTVNNATALLSHPPAELAASDLTSFL
jgi:hypothetical protein